MTHHDKQKCMTISQRYPHHVGVVEDVYECVGDFSTVESILTFSAQRAISVYSILAPIYHEKNRKQSVEFKYQPLMRQAIRQSERPKHLIGGLWL